MDSVSTAGARLGKYSLVAEIARGGMGIVYLAQQSGRHGFRKLVVVKQLKPELAEDDKFTAMFLDEARLAARLNHRNIVQTIEVDQEGDDYYFVMEYLEGRTLYACQRLKGDKALSTGTILRVICDVLAGLHYAHELTDYDGTPLNVVHRDVSPRNIFLTYDGQVKLLDFGVAKAAGRDQETEAGELKGRVPYMAPEQMSETVVDRRVDIFSTGVLLRETLTNKRLWEGKTEVEILRALLQKQLPPLPDDLDISDEAREIIHKSMAPDRDERYRTAHEMRAALEQYLGRIDQTGSFAKVGEHISREFAEHRAEVATLIEQHVAAAESMPPHKNELPTLKMTISQGELVAATPTGTTKPPPTEPKKERDESSSTKTAIAAPTSSAPSEPSQPTAPSSSNKLVAASSAAPVPSPSVAAKQVKDISIPPPPPKSATVTYVFFGIGFLAVVAGLTALILSTRDPDPIAKPIIEPTSTIPTVTGRRPSLHPTASASGNSDDAALIEVTIHASPATALLWIDNVIVGQGPHTEKYKRGTKHTVRATADGYVTKVENFTVDSTASMNISLEKEAGAPAPTFVRPRIPPPPPPPPQPRNVPPTATSASSPLDRPPEL